MWLLILIFIIYRLYLEVLHYFNYHLLSSNNIQVQRYFAGHPGFKLLQVISHGNYGISSLTSLEEPCSKGMFICILHLCAFTFHSHSHFHWQVWEFPSSALFIVDIFVLSSNCVALKGLNFTLWITKFRCFITFIVTPSHMLTLALVTCP